jgi:hypothetical protein
MKKIIIALAALTFLAAPASAGSRSFGGGFRPSIRITPRFSAPKFTMPKTYSAPKYTAPKPLATPKWETPKSYSAPKAYAPPIHSPAPPAVQHHYHDSGPASNIWFWMYLFNNHNQSAPAPAPQPYVPGTTPTATYGQPLPAPPAPAVQTDDKSTAGPRNIGGGEIVEEQSSPWVRNGIFAALAAVLGLGVFFVGKKMRAA